MYHARCDIDTDTDAPSALSAPARAVDLAASEAPERLAFEWQRLERHGAWPTQSHAFAAALEPLLVEAHRRILGARRGRAITAILPLTREDRPLARWRLAGSRELFEPGDLLCARAEDADPVAAAIAALRHPVSLDRISADSPLVPALRKAIGRRGWLSVRPAMPCPVIALDSGWRDPETRFNARRRSDFRRAARRAEAMGQVTFETLAPTAQQFDALFDEAIAVELRSWKRDAGSAIAVDARRELFFRRFFRSAAAEGNFHLSFLRIDGEAVAMQLALLWSGRYWLFKIGHDERFGKCSPGTLLMLHMLGWAAEQRLESFELLGEAEPWSTRFWTDEQRACRHGRPYPYSLPGLLAVAADALAWLRRRLSAPHR